MKRPDPYIEALKAEERLQELSDRLFRAIEHGDQEHREWLREALDCFFAGQPVPPPRGGGINA